MRLLLVGSGFRPLLTGGLISYVEELAASLADRGHDVTYFFHGRYLPWSTRPQLRRWRRGPVTMLELLNGPIVPGQSAQDPAIQLDEPITEAAFRAALDAVRPDVVHVHALSGLPSSLLEIPRERALPVVLSLHDYTLLCPTVKLFDADQRVCTRPAPGEMCQVCCAGAGSVPEVRRTFEAMVLRDERRMMQANNLLNAVRHRPLVGKALTALRPRDAVAPAPSGPPSASPTAYDRRRMTNLRRVAEVDAVLAVSDGVAAICRRLGVAGERLRTVHIALPHIARIRPAERVEPRTPMVFTALNACAGTAKGTEVVLEALDALAARGLADRFRLQVWGFVDPAARSRLQAHPAVDLCGNYTGDDLDEMLAEADVGIVPSVWEEAYGLTGPEMLAGGVPVIGNALGGIPDYVLPEETGWLNQSATGAELASCMARLVEHPQEVAALRRRIRERRPAAVLPFEEHLRELSDVYDELIAAG